MKFKLGDKVSFRVRKINFSICSSSLNQNKDDIPHKGMVVAIDPDDITLSYLVKIPSEVTYSTTPKIWAHRIKYKLPDLKDDTSCGWFNETGLQLYCQICKRNR